MPFLQANLVEEDGRVSGAEIRNEGNFQVLSQLTQGTRAFLRKDLSRQRRHAPTLACLDSEDLASLPVTIEKCRPDFALFEGVALLDAMREVRRAFPRLPIIVDFHNVESTLHRKLRLSRYPRWSQPIADMLLSRRFRAAEEADREAARLADAVWACSAQDADLVRRAGISMAVDVIPNPIPDWCRTAAPDKTPRTDETVLFVGHLGYAPNRRAIAELVTSIMPELRRRFPDAVLHVGGREPRPKLVRLLGDAGHRLTANPPDLAPLYRGAQATAIPLRDGGGTRIKVLEALAVGCPVVATAKAVEGLALEDGRHFIRAETAPEFVAALSRLFQDPKLGLALSTEGRDFVHRTHGDAARADAVRKALATIAVPGRA
ncbi:glycosyltransferase [Aquibium carbonis]|uniref:Glycosyltransferase n=1 Tax=Aquibium carbonis TaxID=2495581 RepID=A0A3R9YII9_9HYPH|nr:glycosyltransferase family 4 protein [Aquibium carbonis]RST80049.1 glycosyltransferase [Aquibium carbonis]